MKICICDDDPQIHSAIEELLRENASLPSEHHVVNLYTGEDLIAQYAQDNTFDLIFLDVELNELDGIQAAKKIREQDETVIIIFVSSYKQYVFDAFPVGAFHYIVKPINPEEFADVYRRSLQKHKDLHAMICLKWMYDRYSIPIHKIIYLEGSQRHVIVHTSEARYEAVGKVSDYVDELIANGFVQVHHSYLVNMDYIKAIQKDKIVLQNGENVWISVRKRADTLKAFDHYLGHRKW